MVKINKKSPQLVDTITNAIQDKKGSSITILDLRALGTAISNYFIICSGNSRPQVEAIMDNVMENVKKIHGENPLGVEGRENAEWILIDFMDVIVHIFQPETRDFYKLEKLWSDAQIKVLEDN